MIHRVFSASGRKGFQKNQLIYVALNLKVKDCMNINEGDRI